MPKKYCPPNTFCLDEDYILKVFIILGLVIFIIYHLNKNNENENDENDLPLVINNDKKKDRIIINNIIDDDEKNLLEPPGRKYFSSGVPINIRTRGKPNNYSQVGILTSQNNPDKILPLFGRQTYRGSNLWNYYSATDSHLATKIPIQTNKNCIDTHGCSEINNGDTINLSNTSENFNVQLYPYNELQYIPYV